MKYFRFVLGRWFIHLGLRILPPGRTRALIADKLLDVRYEIEKSLAQGRR